MVVYCDFREFFVLQCFDFGKNESCGLDDSLKGYAELIEVADSFNDTLHTTFLNDSRLSFRLRSERYVRQKPS